MASTVRDIIVACGGETAVGAITGTGPAIRHWQRTGIPMRHWAALIATGRVTLGEIVEACSATPRWGEQGIRR